MYVQRSQHIKFYIMYPIRVLYILIRKFRQSHQECNHPGYQPRRHDGLISGAIFRKNRASCTTRLARSCSPIIPFSRLTLFQVVHSHVLCRFPPDKHPVLAFKGPPASFPVQIINRPLQQYVVWNKRMQDWAQEYVEREMSGGPYIAVHLRIGSDWVMHADISVSCQLFYVSVELGHVK